MAGLARPSQLYSSQIKPASDPMSQNINDYGNIMKGYGSVDKANTYQPISYNTSGDVSNALGSLKNFSETGGYSPEDISNIRERGISPIRSIYANAQQNLKRRLAIQGGYSPGYAAAVAKMARDSSQQISDTTGNVNATLAQNIIGNRIAGTRDYANLGETEAGRGFDTSRFNEEQKNNYLNRDLSINEARRGLYGTTPGLANMFGQQALEAARLNEQGRQFDQSQSQTAALDLLGRRIQSGGYSGGRY